MKKIDSKGNSSVFYISKGVIILSIILTSSLSFILGFFVGKSYSPSFESQKLVIPLQESNLQKNIGTEKNETPVQQPQQTQEIQLPVETRRTQETQQTQETKKTKDIQQTRVTQPTKETEKNKITQETNKTKEANKPQETSKTRKYTVQAGAFKNATDADFLKKKLEKKGYKTFVIATKTKKHENLYKVMTGEFTTRKEAELLSIKIKNAEGLRTFVTFKTD